MEARSSSSFLGDAFANLPGLILCWMPAPGFICLDAYREHVPSSDYGDGNDIDRLDFLVSVLRQITVRPSLSAPEDNRSRWTPRRSS